MYLKGHLILRVEVPTTCLHLDNFSLVTITEDEEQNFSSSFKSTISIYF